MIRAKTSISIRLPSGKFPKGSYAVILKPARERVRKDIDAAFETKKDPQTGKPWKPRLLQLGRKEPSHKLLQKSGRTKAAALKAASDATITGSSLYVRMRDEPPYAGWHQSGTRRMVPRRFIGASRATRMWLVRRVVGEGVRVIRGKQRY